LGTIIRTAVGFGLSGVIVSPGTTDPFSPKVVRSAMGALFRIPIIVSECNSDLPLIVADMQGQDIRTFIPPQDHILVVGNEGQGVLPELQSKAQAKVSIPIQFESLNAAIAAAICMYQFKK
jgi:TrmH family RNA methyltransferase